MMDKRTLSRTLFVSVFLICTSCSKGQWQAEKVPVAGATPAPTPQKDTPQKTLWEQTKDGVNTFLGTKPQTPSVTHKNSATVPSPYGKPQSNSFCEIAKYPGKLAEAAPNVLLQLVDWRTYMLTNKISVEECLSSCPDPTKAVKDFCHSLSWCRDNCTTSKIVKNCSTNTLAARDTQCVAHNCSPLPPPSEYYDPSKLAKQQSTPTVEQSNIIGVSQPGSIMGSYVVEPRSSDLKVSKEDLEVRKKVFLELSRRIVREFEENKYMVLYPDELSFPDDKATYYSELAKAYSERYKVVKNFLTTQPAAKNNYMSHMPETMLCINLPTNAGGENHYLEVQEQNNGCGNAFGLGQVISMTFYSNMGLNLSKYNYSTQNLDKRCKQAPLQFLATECGPDIFQSQFFRAEIFEKYSAYTIDEIFDRRAFDMDLQVRLMFATVINSFAMTQNWCGAWTSYRGNGNCAYAGFTAGHSCMSAHMAEEYKTDSSFL